MTDEQLALVYLCDTHTHTHTHNLYTHKQGNSMPSCGTRRNQPLAPVCARARARARVCVYVCVWLTSATCLCMCGGTRGAPMGSRGGSSSAVSILGLYHTHTHTHTHTYPYSHTLAYKWPDARMKESLTWRQRDRRSVCVCVCVCVCLSCVHVLGLCRLLINVHGSSSSRLRRLSLQLWLRLLRVVSCRLLLAALLLLQLRCPGCLCPVLLPCAYDRLVCGHGV